jgi:hypothetical protein
MDDEQTRPGDSTHAAAPGALVRFEPGTLFAGRFRIVSLLGRAALATFGFYASRGTEPLFGRQLLD